MLSSMQRFLRVKPEQNHATNETHAAPQDPTQEITPVRPAKSCYYSGIKLLHSSVNDTVDIVFVHGLIGDCTRTWTAKTATEPWPKYLLPPEVPNARILTYGYDATVVDRVQGTPTRNRVRNHAYTLLTSLASFRQHGETTDRPIIFVCHSIGGLICQDALVTSKEQPESHLQSIFHMTRGIIFLGTPHHGLSLTKWGGLAARSVGVTKQTNTEIMQLLRCDSEMLARIQDSFHTLIRARASKGAETIEIACFYEELPMKKVGVVVPKHSAILPGYISIGIHSNHADMTKFDSADEAGFIALCGELKRWINKINRATRNLDGAIQPPEQKEPTTFCTVPYTSNPDFVGRSEIIELLKDQLGHSELQRQSNAHRQASLCGLGGVGKTQIALAYAYWVQETYPKTSVFWVHASSLERFRQGYSSIAKKCQLPGHDDNVLSMVKDWLESESSKKWLMIIDNADDMELFFTQPGEKPTNPPAGLREELSQYIPHCAHGTVLITTRDMQVGLELTKGKLPIEVNRMDDSEATQLLSQGLQGMDEPFDELVQLSSRLEFLPLALVQASAFIQENKISVKEYVELLDTSQKNLIDLLSEEFETVGREDEAPRAVAETWMLSFQQIERQHPFAGELLSLMSLFDRQAIPMEFLEFYNKEKKTDEIRGKIQLLKALGVLKAFCFIKGDKGGGYNMPRLVQLVNRAWLARNGKMQHFARWALLAVSDYYPYGSFESLDSCAAYLSHAHSVLKADGFDSEEDKLVKASLLHRMGALYSFQGRYADAEKLQLEAMSIRKKLLGEEHPETLIVTSDFASSLAHQCR
ncbi:hypothetical protein FZEAL_2181 [Fusarium zealandicum]|uniref:DUF676 domain-containing protein n=1 Tax=Fusarium zealandicum TaxID=1053134 RepID=A0A8H4UR99_9HYPO|nr:hypothetical protein FZEAL_2181 [Fusarium zealandicum]